MILRLGSDVGGRSASALPFAFCENLAEDVE
jgi:hypothetical protein